jgi:cytochrome c biogenesis protein CcmG/thiol:disulfide interchange protein DsbE
MFQSWRPHRGDVRRTRALGFGIVLIGIGGLVAAEIATSGDGAGSGPAPQLPREVLSGHPVTLASLRGSPALINFWASWCGPCKQEGPELERFAKSLHGGARLVGVDWNDSARNARAFIAQQHWSYPVLRDSAGTVGDAFGLTGLPTTFVLDRSGDVIEILRGPQTHEALEQALSRAE